MAKRTERGWAGHFCGARYCGFRRNTLIEYDNGERIIVSTVGNYRPPLLDRADGMEPVGRNRYYETMAFFAQQEGPYWDSDVRQEVSFNSPWGIVADRVDELPEDLDVQADLMHEAVVAELMERIGDA